MPFARIDAAVMWNNGKAYFFSGDQYARYDVATDKVDDGYPLTQPHWPGHAVHPHRRRHHVEQRQGILL